MRNYLPYHLDPRLELGNDTVKLDDIYKFIYFLATGYHTDVNHSEPYREILLNPLSDGGEQVRGTQEEEGLKRSLGSPPPHRKKIFKIRMGWKKLYQD